MAGPTREFWQERFEKKETHYWDRGGASPQLMVWLTAGELTPCRIAVPGCGAGWEVAELAQRNFEAVGIDYAPAAVEQARTHLLSKKLRAQVVEADALTYAPSALFDAIYEQTCLCAIHPDHWFAYSVQLRKWLKPCGSLFAVFMQMPRPLALEQGLIVGPPYHCDINAMRALFTAEHWVWPKPPYVKVAHHSGSHELALRLQLRA